MCVCVCVSPHHRDAAELEEAGADRCVMSTTSAGVALGTEILTRLGASSSEASKVRQPHLLRQLPLTLDTQDH